MNKKIPSEEIQRLLKAIYDDCDLEDQSVRERQIRKWRRLKLLWEGFSQIWFNDVAHDWRIWDETEDEQSDQASYDKPINVFKAYLESIIAALSVLVPPVKCFPDDADNPLDLSTAKAGDKIALLVYRHNNAPLLWLHALFICVTEGLVACYSYPVADEEYGTYENKKYDEIEEEHEITTCPQCGHTLDDKTINPTEPPPVGESPVSGTPVNSQTISSTPSDNLQNNQAPNQNSNPEAELAQSMRDSELDEFMPDNEDAALQSALAEGSELCPACMMQMDPEIRRDKVIITRLVGITKEPKTRMCMEVYGGMNIKIPNYAKKQKDVPYIRLSQEYDYSMVMERFENLQGNRKLSAKLKGGGSQGGAINQYEQWGRLSPQYQGEYPQNVITVSQLWIRPGKYNILEPEQVAKLKKLYPNGVKVTFANDEFAEAENECLDDCWTLLENPLSDYLHFEPAGEGLTSIQEITNDMISLVLQTIEHGIGQTFADPAVINFKAYENTEVTPGGIFPATPKSGKALNDGFHEMKTASLSAEVLPFFQNIQSLAQLESGALPSLFGGQMEGTETASQYSMSRAQALQRLQNTWKMFTSWWKTTFGKVIPMYIKETMDQGDERDVQRNNDGNFVNVFIRRAELDGKIGKVELEANENLPLTWSQKKDAIEKLLTNNNPKILEILSAPENIGIIHEALGLDELYVPGEDDVIKQYDEIKLLLNSEPIETGDPMMPEIPSVEVDPDFDNHPIEFEVCRKWIISPEGRQMKTDNEPGYRNILLHAKLHLQFMQEAAAMQQEQQQQQNQGETGKKGAAPSEKPNPLKTKEAPIQGESDVHQVH